MNKPFKLPKAMIDAAVKLLTDAGWICVAPIEAPTVSFVVFDTGILAPADLKMILEG